MQYRLRTLLIVVAVVLLMAMLPSISVVIWYFTVERPQLLKVNRDRLRENIVLIAEQYRAGEINYVELARANVVLADAEIAAADTSEARAAAMRRKAMLLKQLQSVTTRTQQTGSR